MVDRRSERRRELPAFSEKEFYLQEFRGRTLAIAGEAASLRDAEPIAPVLRSLTHNHTGVLLLCNRRAPLEPLAGQVMTGAGERLEGTIWRALRRTPCVGLATGRGPLPAAARELALRLQLFKVVWLDAEGGLLDARGKRHCFLDRRGLQRVLRGGRGLPPPRRALLREVAAMLEGGVPAINVCTPDGLADELFTYAGSGTLFTRDRYVEVRWLGLDDLSPAHDLVQRGVAEGYLARRTPAELDRVLARGFGAFVEGRHLAGICALLDHPGSRWGELASLYTVTRFLGEGVGEHLLAFALREGAKRGLRRVFACTTSERVGAFFARRGFERIGADAVPARKWRGYDLARRSRVRVYARRTVTRPARRRGSR